jgi:hypothetical protein
VLRELYAVHERAKSPRSAGIKIRDLQKRLRPAGYKQHEVASNLDYLIQKGWAVKEVEARTFTTRRGTTQSSEEVRYKISATGIDKLEGASLYERPPANATINITNIRGVTVVGDGNVVNTEFTELEAALTDLRRQVLESVTVRDEVRLDIVADVDGLLSQLQKPQPDHAVVRKLWSNIERLLTAAEVADLAIKAGTLIAPLLS